MLTQNADREMRAANAFEPGPPIASRPTHTNTRGARQMDQWEIRLPVFARNLEESAVSVGELGALPRPDGQKLCVKYVEAIMIDIAAHIA
jgi:hypothetical protein